MRDSHRKHHSHLKGRQEPAFQIICLAPGGGPSEDNVTGFLVRSVTTNWAKGSVLALDAGSHLAAISRLLQPHFPLVSSPRAQHTAKSRTGKRASTTLSVADETLSESGVSTGYSTSPSPEPEREPLASGPFAGLRFPHDSARANALWVVRECISAYLITHPHLDHLSGFAINTAGFHNTTRPKKLAALPSTVNAIKAHIFNDVIWPNLTDEDGGVGFVTFQRLAPGGNIAVGEGSKKGYIEVCDGLCVKGFKISHGKCMRVPHAALHSASEIGLSEPPVGKSGTSADAQAQALRRSSWISQSAMSPNDTSSVFSGDPGHHRGFVVDSTAYFVRDDSSGREILFFGDVEPDSLSLNPRTAHVWAEAAPKIAHGTLRAVLIECSYDDSQGDSVLFGHLAPRHLFQELVGLAAMVRARRAEEMSKRMEKKRKLSQTLHHDVDDSILTGDEEAEEAARSKRVPTANTFSTTINSHHNAAASLSVPGEAGDVSPHSHPGNAHGMAEDAQDGPLHGLTVVVIHIKDTLQDGQKVEDRILMQLRDHEARLKESDGFGLGCEFVISEFGASYWF